MIEVFDSVSWNVTALLAIDDLDGDGHGDVAVSGGSGTFLASGAGDGGFVVSRWPGGSLSVGDFDGDGKKDVAMGTGLVRFGDGRQFQADAGLWGQACDVDGDGKDDLLDVDTVWMGGGNGLQRQPLPSIQPGENFTLLDVNGDHRKDRVWMSLDAGANGGPSAAAVQFINSAGAHTW